MNSSCPAQTIRAAIASVTLMLCSAASIAQTPLADKPIFASVAVPGNLALALSVEYPTAVSVAHKDTAYNSASTYLGYFDPAKCYVYVYDIDETQRYFAPSSTTTNRTCSGKWSGNFMNWATMQTIDPFRWALTGGYRSTDTTSLTLVEKAWASGQGGAGNFPNRSLPNTAAVSGATPLSFSSLAMRVQGLGNKLRFTQSGNVDNTPTVFTTAAATVAATTYEVSVRVRVCDNSVGLEANCVQFSTNNYKPIGLIQQYADKIRYSAFGYLNDGTLSRDGGVLRAKQKFVGPTKPVPGGLPVSNPDGSEWATDTGIMVANPNPTDAAITATNFGVTIANSGVMNYLNKFGELTQSNTSYKTYDPVGELYYTALRYFKNQGNVPEYTSMTGANTATKTTWADGFPVITTWDDPVLYSCQKNFILGIGDTNTHADRNLPGASGNTEPAKPAAVTADTTVNALTATDTVGVMHGISNLGTRLIGSNNAGYLMAGLAYDANTVDIRPDITGKQTVQTYWIDVLESGFANNNQFYLAAKYGGFTVPENFAPYPRTADISQSWWYTSTDVVGPSSQKRPDNYFTAAQPDLMVTGLTKAFSSIASKLNGFSTGFATATPQFSADGVASYAARYDASTWSGDVIGNTVSFQLDTNVVSSAQAWQFSAKLTTQAAGTGWQNGRFIATYNTDTRSGVPFQIANLSSSQVSNLDTAYRSGSDSTDYLNYLRGDPSQEQGSAVANSSKAYRARTNLVGDIVNAQLLVVGPPANGFSDAANPGYSQFKTTNASRKTVVYAGTNRGMLHAIDGSLTGTTAGKELFAYVPGAAYAGPTGTPATNGLQSIGNPTFVHYNFVDATPISADVDLGKTVGGSGSDWRTILIGGLGKGGKGFYALDVTTPSSWTSEAAVAGKVLWEFTDGDMGYSYGQATLAKTKKYGWVAIFGSGYNNADGRGYFYIVNPRTGALLEKIGTGVGSTNNPAGLARVKPFFLDVTDGTADSVYAGDLLGNVWRLDVSAASGGYPAPVRLAQLTDAAGLPLPVTSRPTVAVQPSTNRRFVTVGTGRLLSDTDLSNTQGQRFYALIDGTGSAFSAAQPNGSSYPIQSSDLKALTDLTRPISLDLSRYAGWYVDLGAISAGPGWRVIVDPTSFYGGVSFAAMAPSSGDPCNPAGNSRVYSIDLGTGQSLLQNNTAYMDVSGVVISLGGTSVSGQYRIITATTDGPKPPIKQNPAAPASARRLNWREIPLTN